MAQISVLILAAGKGTRMKSSLAKVLHKIGGQPMIERVIKTLEPLKPAKTAVIIGHQGEDVKKYLSERGHKFDFYWQKVLDGSGGAVRQALSWLGKQKGDVIVACGDAPLFLTESIKALVETHAKEGNAATVLTTKIDNPRGYGRIVRGSGGQVLKIVEELDATDGQRQINEINTGTYCFKAQELAKALPLLQNNNQKKEYYLTDVLEILRGSGGRVGASICEDFNEALGINSRKDLAKALNVVFRRKIDALMADGVTVIDPASTFVDESVQVGPDTVIWPQTILRGHTKIGSNCEVGPWAQVTDTIIENNVVLRASFADQATVKQGALVGPYARLRPKAVVGRNVHVGNFSELKNTVMEEGSKVNHLSYLGDAKVGKNVNIGAGTITCNYDGINKFPTTIQDHAFIGSNVNLIAPVTVGAHAVVGAGSSISDDVPAWSLMVERAPSVVKKGWAKAKFKNAKAKKRGRR